MPESFEAETIRWGVVIGASLVAALLDVRQRRIPNWLTLPLVPIGFAVGAWQGGWLGFGSSVVACVALALPYVIVFALAGGGAGDAKMMAAIGAWLGLVDGVVVLVAVAGIGGMVGAVKTIADKRRGTRLGDVLTRMYLFLIAAGCGRREWELLRIERNAQTETGENDEQARGAVMPYGLAIFAGVCIGALVVHTWKG